MQRQIGLTLVAAFVVLLSGLYVVLTEPYSVLDTASKPSPAALVINAKLVMLAAILAGALGGCLHVASSFADYVGNQKFTTQWNWWYYLRPFVGATLAVVFVCVAKSGLLGDAQAANAYAMAALAAMVGLFSKQATDKLDDVLDTLLNTDKDEHRADSLKEKPGSTTTEANGTAPRGQGAAEKPGDPEDARGPGSSETASGPDANASGTGEPGTIQVGPGFKLAGAETLGAAAGASRPAAGAAPASEAAANGASAGGAAEGEAPAGTAQPPSDAAAAGGDVKG